MTARSNSAHRRRLRQWLLVLKGDGEMAPCVFCGRPLDSDTLTLDRVVPGVDGGRYTRDNVQPACAKCNVRRGARLQRNRRRNARESSCEHRDCDGWGWESHPIQLVKCLCPCHDERAPDE